MIYHYDVDSSIMLSYIHRFIAPIQFQTLCRVLPSHGQFQLCICYYFMAPFAPSCTVLHLRAHFTIEKNLKSALSTHPIDQV